MKKKEKERKSNSIFCPSCGKEIPIKSTFCMHCGKPIITTKPTPVSTEWEYDDCILEVGSKIHVGTVGKNYSYSDVVQHAWLESRPSVLKAIQEWLDNGWEPVTQVGPDCMTIETLNAGFFVGTKVYLTGFSIKMRRQRN